jgi:Flp pilus assembly pilin Flp
MFTKLAKRFWNDEQGLELSEYAIMIALIIAISILAITTLGGKIKTMFTSLGTALDTAAS